MAYPATEKLPARPAQYDRDDTNADSNVGLKLLVLFLGLAVGVMIPLGVWLAASAQDARNDAKAAVAKAGIASSAAPMPGMPGRVAGTMSH